MSTDSDFDSEFFKKLHSVKRRKRKFPELILKRNKREGMCMLSGDDKSSQELNLIRIETDLELEEHDVFITDCKSKGKIKSPVNLTNDIKLKNAMCKSKTVLKNKD